MIATEAEGLTALTLDGGMSFCHCHPSVMLMLPYTFCVGDKVALRSLPRANFDGIAIRHGLHAGLTALRCRRDSLWGHGLAI